MSIHALFSALHVPPFLLLLVAKCWCLRDLSFGDLVHGSMAEVSGPALWGGRSSEGCRKIKIFFATYYLLLYTVFLALAISESTLQCCMSLTSRGATCFTCHNQAFASICLVLGWVSYPILLLQGNTGNREERMTTTSGVDNTSGENNNSSENNTSGENNTL